MATCFASNRLGVAVYDVARGALSAAEAAEHEKDLPTAPVLQLFKYQFQPTQLIAPSRSDDLFLEALRRPIGPSAPPSQMPRGVMLTSALRLPACLQTTRSRTSWSWRSSRRPSSTWPTATRAWCVVCSPLAAAVQGAG
eukprot:COSAG04_NODE_8276_length_997_cov_2.000000_1_plen_139_part_00